MSLELVLGRSGAGKSEYVFNMALNMAKKSLKNKCFIIVPDQFTMQTQSDLVKMSPNGGIMNIDVLSFSRLAHRVFEETGAHRLPVLDDTGKNLILRRLASDIKDDLPYLGGKLDKPGYIHEVKSAISEFMQYGLGDRELEGLIEYAGSGKKGMLAGKLKDLRTIYEEFKNYTANRFITTEESVTLLSKEIYKSKLLSGSTVIMDGFTGFTPVQLAVVLSLLEVCERVIITLTCDPEREPLYGRIADRFNGELTADKKTGNTGILFELTEKSIESLLRLCRDNDIDVLPPMILSENQRHKDKEDMQHLEEALFAYPVLVKNIKPANIHIAKCIDSRTEVKLLIHNMRNIMQSTGTMYRDFAIITGNMATYKGEIEEQFARHNIPVFIDEMMAAGNNPFVEFVKSSLNLLSSDFSFESVMRYLKTGFSDILPDDVDLFEEYIRETGIRGRKAYMHMFTRETRDMKKSHQNSDADDDCMTLKQAEEIRIAIKAGIEPLLGVFKSTSAPARVEDIVKALYKVILISDSYGKLASLEEKFRKTGDYSREKEYSQIYGATMALLEQVYGLIGEEEASVSDFLGIIDAGFDEVRVGAIPQNVDRVIVGDMERTRLKPVRFLFFLGLNEGWVPANVGNGGIISDIDREFLARSEYSLAPSPRQKIAIGRFYLYSNLVKPREAIFASYLAMDNDGSSLRPSSCIDDIKCLFKEGITETFYSDPNVFIESVSDARDAYATLVRKAADNTITEEGMERLQALSRVLSEDAGFLEKMISNAYYRYEGSSLNPVVAGLLYGDTIFASISRMEKYAECAYAYFLKYGLGLKESQEYEISAIDMGSIYHAVLEKVIVEFEKRGYNWFTVQEEEIKEIVESIIEDETALYSDALFYENASNRYVLDRMKKVMTKTVNVLSYQLKKGSFRPVKYELEFGHGEKLDIVNPASGKVQNLYINGKIDRVDVSENADSVYVKILDYKSSDKDFSLACFYHGVQLQMVVYMNEAVSRIKSEKSDKKVSPAALLYYSMDDPYVTPKSGDSATDIEALIKKELRTRGIVCADEDIILSLDNSGEAKSDVIPVDHKANGDFTAASSVISSEDLEIVSKYASHKMRTLGKEIIKGRIDKNPIAVKKSESTVVMDSCQYCSYKQICGFNENLPGYEKKIFEKEDEDSLLEAMRSELDGGN